MDWGIETRYLRNAAAIATLLVACGGTTTGGPMGSGGNGGTGPSTGGSGPLLDCQDPIAAAGTPCAEESAHCGGPCSNSWQVENVCTNGTWKSVEVVPCGPDASHAPQCKNSFSGGQLTPCCPIGQLDCAGKPDGYPGFGCTPGDGSFCSCTCYSGQPNCGC